jgi:hypothetical protein
MGIKLKLQIEGKAFKHIKRQNKGVIYRSVDSTRMVKKCIVYREEFFDELPVIKEVLQDLSCFLHLYDWADKKEKMYMTEWVNDIKPLKVFNIENKIELLKKIEGDLYILFDEGFYWEGNWEEDILITPDNHIRICDLDSIKPIWINSTFEQHYPWHWIIK